MSANILDGKALARAIHAALEPEIAAVRRARGAAPKLAIVTCAEEKSTQAYLQAKLKAAAETGLLAEAHHPEAGALQQLISRLGADAMVDGIIVEQPLPKGLNQTAIFSAIPASKDVEGLSPLSYGLFFQCKTAAEIKAAQLFPPCTVSAVIALLAETRIHVAGKEAVVVGRSEILGRPAAHYLSALDATVTLCHSQTADLPAHVRRADIVVACLGRAHFIKGAWIKPGAVVIDAGMNQEDGAWVGDVEFAAAAQRAAFITPVPGGVGPVTAALALANTVHAAQRRLAA